jgi:DNA-binding Lrp family transcriptional regulator
MTKKEERNKGSTIHEGPSAAFEVVVNRMKTLPRKEGTSMREYGIDKTDLEIIRLLLSGYSNTEIGIKIGKPLSTVQRRTRKLIEKGYVHQSTRLDFTKFGLRRGLLYFKCKSANLEEAVEKIYKIRGVASVAAYLGSLDVIANVVYADSKEVLSIISQVQKLDLISDVTWSEEIHARPRD